jgi:hypothetical protein
LPPKEDRAKFESFCLSAQICEKKKTANLGFLTILVREHELHMRANVFGQKDARLTFTMLVWFDLAHHKSKLGSLMLDAWKTFIYVWQYNMLSNSVILWIHN